MFIFIAIKYPKQAHERNPEVVCDLKKLVELCWAYIYSQALDPHVNRERFRKERFRFLHIRVLRQNLNILLGHGNDSFFLELLNIPRSTKTNYVIIYIQNHTLFDEYTVFRRFFIFSIYILIYYYLHIINLVIN